MRNAIVFAADDSNCVLVSITHNYDLPIGDKVRWPARWNDKVLSVGSMNRDITLADYSNYMRDSLKVDVVAPVGGGIIADSHTPCGAESEPCPCSQSEVTGLSGGTSSAAPQAAGIAALIRSRFRHMPQDSVRARIKRGAEFYWESDPLGRNKFGAGKINAYRSITEWGRVATNSITHRAVWGGQQAGWPDTLYVSGDLFVEAGDTLVLNKGTVVRVAPEPISHNEGEGGDPSRVEIVVRGTLRTGNTGSGPIIFESFTDSPPTDHDWAGIRFEATSENNVLENVVIKNAQVGIRNFSSLTLESCTMSDCIEGIESHADIVVRHSTISNCSSYGIEVVSGNAVIDSVTISNCGVGVSVDGGPLGGSSVICSDSYIHDLGLHGMTTSSSDDTLTVLRTRIENAFYGIAFAQGTPGLVDSCTIKYTDTGVLLASSSQVVVKNSVIENNTTNGIYSNLTAGNLISSNSVKNNPVGVMCYGASPVIKNGNTIQNNASGIKCDTYSNAFIEWNTISLNGDGVDALNNSNPDLGQEGGGGSLGNNTIMQNTGFHVVNLTPSVTVMAENNWWGSAAGPKANKFSGDVDYTPWLTSAPGEPPPGVSPPSLEEEALSTTLPARYDLAPNYPNPFNPTTRLRFEVPPPGAVVKIVVYNIKGQPVRTLLDEGRAPGVHTLIWDGTGENGEVVASGVYFVHMKAGSFRETKKIVRLK